MNARDVEMGKELISDYLAEVFKIKDLKAFARACKMIGTSQDVNLSDLDALFKIDNHMKKYHGASMFFNKENRRDLEVALEKHGIVYAEVR